jgi:hypothetical protein
MTPLTTTKEYNLNSLVTRQCIRKSKTFDVAPGRHLKKSFFTNRQKWNRTPNHSRCENPACGIPYIMRDTVPDNYPLQARRPIEGARWLLLTLDAPRANRIPLASGAQAERNASDQ